MTATPRIVSCGACATRNRVPGAATGTPRCGRCKTPLPWITDADDSTFASVAERSPLPVIVDLWAPWCGPCRTLGPILEQLAVEFAGHCKLVKVNVDDAPALSQRFDAGSIPTLLFMRDGRVVSRRVGAAPADQLRDWVRSAATPDSRERRADA